MNRERSILSTVLRSALTLLMVGQMLGCEVDSFFNPSITGYWEHTPTTIPILDRLDVIEQGDELWGQTTDVSPEDLMPNDLSYRMIPGDFVTIQIYELYVPQQWTANTRRIDAGGFLRVPEMGDVKAAGLTPQQFEDALVELLRQLIISPQVDVVVEQGGAFYYTLYGHTPAPGLYTLINPDLRLADALATAGGISQIAKRVFIIRKIELTEDVKPSFERDLPTAAPEAAPEISQPVDIEELIEQLDEGDGAGQDVRPGVLRQDGEPVIDIDDLEPVRVADSPEVDIDQIRSRRSQTENSGSWIYVEEQGEWVRVAAEDLVAGGPAMGSGEPPLYLERVIEIPIDGLLTQSKYNIVIRPNDRIYVEPPPAGMIYIEGQISRGGTFSLPSDGITLSRLVAAAGGLNGLAIPERVDLIRMVGENREAVVRLNLGAIRQRTEPDVRLKPDDHIIIGTNWLATPLAIIRNGFRATYGFGFLLDRNFGNDVFGAPPVNYRGPG